MVEDREVKAMQAVVEALEAVEDAEARSRVIKWTAERFGVALAQKGVPESGIEGGQVAQVLEYATFAELHSAASPGTESEHALVGGYWRQIVQTQTEFAAQEVNDDLKNLGHAIGNITVAFNYLRAKKPALVLQLQKSGTSKQARKKYKLTQAGVTEVERMIASEDVEK